MKSVLKEYEWDFEWLYSVATVREYKQNYNVTFSSSFNKLQICAIGHMTNDHPRRELSSLFGLTHDKKCSNEEVNTSWYAQPEG